MWSRPGYIGPGTPNCGCLYSARAARMVSTHLSIVFLGNSSCVSSALICLCIYIHVYCIYITKCDHTHHSLSMDTCVGIEHMYDSIICTGIYICMYIQMCVYIHACIYINMCIFLYTYNDRYTYIYI